MPRPRRIRRIYFDPEITYFKPAGVPLAHLQEVVLTKDELEAVRLIDSEGVEQGEAGKKMNISQPTLSRLLKSARKKLSDAMINGKAIKIEGGNFEMVRPRGGRFRAPISGGRGRQKGNFAAGPSGECVCPKCGYKEKHRTGVPCYKKKCPKCGSLMKRG